MESPPSFSIQSEVPPLSEDSGLFITSGSFSSDSASGWHHVASELLSDDDRSLSLCESAETPERMCGDNFNTVKKGPGKLLATTLEPPPEFQDKPSKNPVLSKSNSVEVRPTEDTYKHVCYLKNSSLDVPISSRHASPIYPRSLKTESLYERRQCLNHRYASPRLLHLSPCRGTRPSSRNSLSSRLSSSHNSLVTQFLADDSSFITQAISHDTLTTNTSDITDMYNVPFDSDIYAVPVDMVRPMLNSLKHKGKKFSRTGKKRKSISYSSKNQQTERNHKTKDTRPKESKLKKQSVHSSSSMKSMESDSDSLHMTLREMRKYLHTLYSSSSDSENKNNTKRKNNAVTKKIEIIQPKPIRDLNSHSKTTKETSDVLSTNLETNNNKKHVKIASGTKCRKHKDNAKDYIEYEKIEKSNKGESGASQKSKISAVRLLSWNLKQSFCNLFRWRRGGAESVEESETAGVLSAGDTNATTLMKRALPPLPAPPSLRRAPQEDDNVTDFATSIQKVKDYGWYWGPISVEAAEKILLNEPDGSFIVRDSSDDHYIFTLTFKLNGLRHVRIEHDQGNFCFGGCTMFKAQTIVEFIENAVETSRSGRYLFFLNLRPVLGPMRVQLLYPVSRFKRVQSLQHMCRFVILKNVRRDLISSLPIPRRLVDYLSATHYYSEMLADI